MLSRFHLIPERHGQTDRLTDRRTELLYQYRASVCCRAIKIMSYRLHVIHVPKKDDVLTFVVVVIIIIIIMPHNSTNSKSCMIYPMVQFPVTLSDP